MTVIEVLDILSCVYPSPKSELNYKDNFGLLIAVILSAQATDISVNKVTPALFQAYPTPEALAKANQEDVIDLLKTIGLYRNKSKFVIETSKKLAEAFNIPAIAVDTHVSRVAKRLGWAAEDDSVLQVEEKLMKKIPKERWGEAHHQILLFGRYHSTARDKRDVYQILSELKEIHSS